MTDDIVDRLYELRDRIIERVMHDKGGALMSIPANPEHDADCIVQEAADEIETLRQQADDWKRIIVQKDKEIERLKAELATVPDQIETAVENALDQDAMHRMETDD